MTLHTTPRMPVLEITQLRLRGVLPDDPQLLHSLSLVRDKLQTKSRFYICIEDPTIMYILGIWRDLEQHLDFLASPARDEVLGPQEDMLEFHWTVHMKLDSMGSLPLDAPILALERIRVEEDGVDAVEQAITRHAQQLLGSHSSRVTHGWRCDAAPENQEVIILSGWETVQAHVTFSARQQSQSKSEHANLVRGCEDIGVHHVWNLELKGT
jgi:heme-degrading monooxygenase HmoA